MERLLIVDDEPGIRLVLCGVLESAGYAVDAVESGEAALEQLAQREYDLLLVDLQMAGMDGLSLIQAARASHPALATVILTGFATVDSAVWALREGVDDYLVKPARPETIRKTIRHVLDRRQASQEQAATLARIARDMQTLLGQAPLAGGSPSSQGLDAGSTGRKPAAMRCGPLLVDEAAHRAEWHGEPLALTPTEFRLLACLARHAGTVLAPQELVIAAQGYECSPAEARELVKPHLYSLRAKLEPDPAHPRYLVNVRGVGYLLRLEE